MAPRTRFSQPLGAQGHAQAAQHSYFWSCSRVRAKKAGRKRRTLRSSQSTQGNKKSHSGRSRSAAPARVQNGALRLQEGRRPRHLRKCSSSDAQGRRTALRHQDHRSKVPVERRSEVSPTRGETAGNPKAPAHRLPSRKFWKEELARRTRSVYCDGVLLGRRFGTVGFETKTATKKTE